MLQERRWFLFGRVPLVRTSISSTGLCRYCTGGATIPAMSSTNVMSGLWGNISTMHIGILTARLSELAVGSIPSSEGAIDEVAGGPIASKTGN